MAYKNDSYLVIANKFGSASGDAKAMLFETYDKLRDLTVSGSGQGTGFEATGGFLYSLASMLAPSSFATVFGGSDSMNIPGTSYNSSFSGSTSFGIDSLYNYSGFPGGAAPAAYGVGAANGYGFFAKNIVLPVAGVISGWGGIMQAAAPYLGEYGLPALVMGNLMQGTTSSALAAYQRVTGNITANADTILSNKVRNIETVCKMLDTQGDVVKKMLKESIDGDSKAIQNL